MKKERLKNCKVFTQKNNMKSCYIFICFHIKMNNFISMVEQNIFFHITVKIYRSEGAMAHPITPSLRPYLQGFYKLFGHFGLSTLPTCMLLGHPIFQCTLAVLQFNMLKFQIYSTAKNKTHFR